MCSAIKWQIINLGGEPERVARRTKGFYSILNGLSFVSSAAPCSVLSHIDPTHKCQIVVFQLE